MLSRILFYSIDKAIKRYRQFAQANIDRAGFSITIDQWLVLNVIQEKPDSTQMEIAERTFKDQASIARIIHLLIQQKLVAVENHPTDRRRSQMRVTAEGNRILEDVMPTILNNRAVALRGISEEEIAQLQYLLEKIFTNCSNSKSHETQLPNQDDLSLQMGATAPDAANTATERA
ncbi:MarR family winged helix-turn-helix transcriptional regulator [Telluribacter sp. SYSU D00476]|uniref:MarR family winged helix-turn-helix transcriptional regulator n=1 Tax=Telluribacter sp. SYSU D00476 TaxID=2811430 RepID=UPI001FF1E2F2|nr:MarR family winged helix-turn-helix transcriptional regulator [Telluribacter sp. SYSU D00476]